MTTQEWRLIFTATAHATFPLDYHSKIGLRLVMMFIVETRNRTPHVKKHDLRQSAKIKDGIWNAKRTNSKLYIMYWLDLKIWIKAKSQICCMIYLLNKWEKYAQLFRAIFEKLLIKFKIAMGNCWKICLRLCNFA